MVKIQNASQTDVFVEADNAIESREEVVEHGYNLNLRFCNIWTEIEQTTCFGSHLVTINAKLGTSENMMDASSYCPAWSENHRNQDSGSSRPETHNPLFQESSIRKLSDRNNET